MRWWARGDRLPVSNVGRPELARRRLALAHVARVRTRRLSPGPTEIERAEKFSGPLPARRPCLFGRGRQALRAEAAWSRHRRDDPRIPAAARSLPRQPDEGLRALNSPCLSGMAKHPWRLFQLSAKFRGHADTFVRHHRFDRPAKDCLPGRLV